MKSIDLAANTVKARSGVTRKGRYFTTAEKVRQVRNEKERKARRSAALALLEEEKRKVRDERACREAALEAIHAKRELVGKEGNGISAATPIKTKKDGTRYVQPKVKGRFGKGVTV